MTKDAALAVLDVPADASRAQIRRTYRLRLRQAHPDMDGDPRLFADIQRAGQVLGVSFKTMGRQSRAHRSKPAAGSEAPETCSTHPETTPGDPAVMRLRNACHKMHLALHYERLRHEAQAQREAEEAAFLARFGIVA